MLNFINRGAKSLSYRFKMVSMANRAGLSFAQKKPLNYFSFILKSYHLYRQFGFYPDETLKLGLINLGTEIEQKYISKDHMVAMQRKFNPESFWLLTGNKALFYEYCRHVGLPIPKLLGMFFKNSQGMNWKREELFGESKWAEFFEKDCPEEFVVKPSQAQYGDGILFIEKNRPEFSGVELFRKLNNHPNSKYQSFVMQECLKNHPDLMAVFPKRGLQTIRLITHIKNNEEPIIVYAFFKPIVGENRIDNHKGGQTGNLLSEIKLSDGSLKTPLWVTDKGPIIVYKHPDTNEEFNLNPLPLWDDACELAKNAARFFLPLRSIGWDMALTPDGVRIIEGNALWDPPMFGNFGKKDFLSMTGL